MANLPWSQLSKYNDRIDLFVKKINEREEFDLVKGGRLVLDINPIGGYEKWFKDLSVSPKAPQGVIHLLMQIILSISMLLVLY